MKDWPLFKLSRTWDGGVVKLCWHASGPEAQKTNETLTKALEDLGGTAKRGRRSNGEGGDENETNHDDDERGDGATGVLAMLESVSRRGAEHAEAVLARSTGK